MQYELIVYWSQHDNAFIAEIPELTGCRAKGSSYEDAVTNAQAEMRDWIIDAHAKGLTPPAPHERFEPAKWNPYQLTAKDAFEIVHREIHAEHGLIANRMLWYMTSQSFLMSAFILSGATPNHSVHAYFWFARWLIPMLGILVSMVIHRSLRAALQAMEILRNEAETIEKDHGLRAIPFRALHKKAPSIHPDGIWPPKILPIVFLFAWVVVLICALMPK